MLFTSSLLSTSLIKTRPAQKLLVRMKFTGNLYSYVCEWLPLKYMQTRVCRNSYTVLDSYLCLCECSLNLADWDGNMSACCTMVHLFTGTGSGWLHGSDYSIFQKYWYIISDIYISFLYCWKNIDFFNISHY